MIEGERLIEVDAVRGVRVCEFPNRGGKVKFSVGWDELFSDSLQSAHAKPKTERKAETACKK